MSPWLTWWPRVPCRKDLRFVQRDVFAWAVKSHRSSNIRRSDGRLHYHEFQGLRVCKNASVYRDHHIILPCFFKTRDWWASDHEAWQNLSNILHFQFSIANSTICENNIGIKLDASQNLHHPTLCSLQILKGFASQIPLTLARAVVRVVLRL